MTTEQAANDMLESLSQQIRGLQSFEMVPKTEADEMVHSLTARIAVLWQENISIPSIKEEDHDGHCAFRGFARQHLGDVNLFQEARQQAFEHLKNNRSRFEALVAEEEMPWEQYIYLQKGALGTFRTDVFADKPILSALAESYSCRILLYHHYIAELSVEYGQHFVAGPVRLIYWDRLHFDSILISDNRVQEEDTLRSARNFEFGE